MIANPGNFRSIFVVPVVVKVFESYFEDHILLAFTKMYIAMENPLEFPCVHMVCKRFLFYLFFVD